MTTTQLRSGKRQENPIFQTIKRLEFPVVFFLIFAMVFGLIFIKIIPPLQAPDEVGHLVKADALSRFKVRPETRTGKAPKKADQTWGFYGFEVSDEIYRMNEYAVQKWGENEKYPYMIKSDGDNSDKFIGTGGMTNYSFVNYIPQITAIWVGKLFNQRPLNQYYIARYFNLFAYIFVVFAALAIFPFSKWGGAVIGLNPMAMFLASTVSGDAMIIAGGFFFTSWILHLRSKKRISSPAMLISMVMMIGLVLMKPTMITLGMLFFLLPNKALSVRRKIAWGILILALSIGFYLWWNSFMIDQQTLYRDFSNPSKQVAAFFKDPSIFLTNFYDNYVLGIKGDYITRSAVGDFGLLDAPMATHWIIFYFSILIVASLLQKEDGGTLALYQKGIIVLLLILYTLLTFFALYQIWNPVNAKKTIEGLQGRYFIPVGLTMVPLFSSHGKGLDVSKRSMNIILSISLVILFLVALSVLNERY
ncbi:DUF2142 domain-containing protein [Enterococcus sp. AZ072]|uniref:DUF2142 domain-containing protein n=1 Tax=unclassified Enterococcus TaxID=2608891 RepID=UPI003D275316